MQLWKPFAKKEMRWNDCFLLVLPKILRFLCVFTQVRKLKAKGTAAPEEISSCVEVSLIKNRTPVLNQLSNNNRRSC